MDATMVYLLLAWMQSNTTQILWIFWKIMTLTCVPFPHNLISGYNCFYNAAVSVKCSIVTGECCHAIQYHYCFSPNISCWTFYSFICYCMSVSVSQPNLPPKQWEPRLYMTHGVNKQVETDKYKQEQVNYSLQMWLYLHVR